MPIWPFNLRRRKTMNNAAPEPLSEKSGNLQAAAGPVTRPSRASSTGRKRRSRQTIDEKAERIEDKDAITRHAGKENVVGGYRRRESVDEVTALPVKWKLDHSPHLRPVDSERAQIPYNFQNNATSQTSVGPTEGSSSKPGTLRSKRSTIVGTPVRRKSSKKRPDEKLREEEIRAMSATMPLPKRPGDGPLRRDSYKRRTFTNSEASKVSLPRATADTPTRTAAQQNDWEIDHFWINPRPAVRLSQTPAYTHDSAEPSLPLSREVSQKVRDKTPVNKESRGRRHRTVGAEADVLDSNDIRALLERDAKRRERRDRDKQERLERKLRNVDKSRRNSDRRREDREFDKAIEAGVPAAVPQRPEIDRAQSSVHPALRDEPAFGDNEIVGLGIGQAQPGAARQNPFETPVATPVVEDKQLESGTPLQTPFDDPVIETAREVRMATAVTPPLSPVDGRRRSSILANFEPLPPQVSAPPPPSQSQTRRAGSQSRDRRGAWASFFRRNGTPTEARSPQTSFANVSRESMGRQPIPLHLNTSTESAFRRSSTGVPTRTMSRFREDLPDAPLSPPDSRVQSPELPPNAVAIAAAAAARHAATIHEDTQAGAHDPTVEANAARSDTPVSPVRAQGPLSGSLASVDSEGSWLASGGSIKRASAQSGLSRSFGSLRRRTPELNASFEDLGSTGDKDAEYLQRGVEAQRLAKVRSSGSPLIGNVAEDEAAENPVTLHESVRRKPTLVHRQPAARSREGLLSDFSGGELGTAIKDDSGDEYEMANENAQVRSARSIDYGSRHARQISAGSAKLLDVAPRRMSASPASPTSPTSKTSADQHPSMR